MFTSGQIARSLLRGAVTSLAGCMLFAAPAAAAQGAAECPGALDVPTQEGLDDAADAVVCLVNAERTSRGLRRLQRDGDLAQAARKHSADMVRRNYFSHVTPGGSTLGDRIRDAGYGRSGRWRAGENLGWGTGSRATPNSLVDEWLDSPAHKRIMLEDSYRELGVGVASGAPRETRSGLPGATYTLNLGTVR
jgi:uncharacterized protein YkwD